ncbi:hypothetical protein LCGC14_1957560 [marine sediment metagenome]|uniref:Spore protein YkvP/CgeB glycosyl transferase-like domain-containing protein n=1 Tax=marine sediment metagenome TaxID=412755 RepID=A0A0F9HTX4_9ZZZZ
MKVLIWTCGFASQHAGSDIYREAVNKNFDVRIAGSRSNPIPMWVEFCKYKPDWVFCLAIHPRLSEFYRKIRESNCKLLFWYPDQCDGLRDRLWRTEYKDLADALVFSILDTAKKYDNLAKDVYWMPQYFDKALCYDRNGKLPLRLDTNKEIYDLCFIGSTDGLRRKWLIDLQSMYKCKFVIVNRPGTPNEVRGIKMASIYAQSKIAINIQRRNFLNPDYFSTSNRAYNAMGSGVFYINHALKNMELMWKEKIHCVTYDNTFNQLVQTIDYYLKHEKEREQIALAGQQNILEFHSLEKRVGEYWKVMEDGFKKEKR